MRGHGSSVSVEFFGNRGAKQNKNGAAESQASRVAATVLRELNDTRTRQRAQCVFRTYLKIPRVRDRSIWAQF